MKTILLLAALLNAAELFATPATKPDGKTLTAEECDCCRKEAAAGGYTRGSLYQADAVFTDDSGKPFRLGQLRGRPVVINMFFTSCGYACPLVVNDLVAMQSELAPELRQKTTFVLVSFDVKRDTVEALAKYREAHQLDENWVLLRGADDAVRELAALLGVKFKQEADGSFAHSNLFTIINREGEIIHQRTGLNGGLEEARAALTSRSR